jgi:hypothetical protein
MYDASAAAPHQAQANAAKPAASGAMAEYPYAEAEAALVEWQLAQLKELVEIQMEVARELPRKVAGLKPSGATTGESESAAMLANAQSRIAAAVQRSIALQNKLIEERRQRWLGLEELKTKRQEGAAKARDEATGRGRRRLTEIARDMAENLRLRDVKAELLRSLLRSIEDKLGSDDLYDNLSHFGQDPIGVTLAKLVKSARIQLDWRVFKDEAWAQPEIAARDPRSPFACLWMPEPKPPNGGASSDRPNGAGPDPGKPPPA